jgi:membrane-bound lytic murein transglycosylase
MYKKIIILFFIVVLCSGCSSDRNLTAFNSGRTDVQLLQERFRDSILSAYVDNTKDELIIAEAVSPNNANYQEAEVTPELKAWRAELQEDWKELQNNQLDVMCELFYEGLVDEAARFANIFEYARGQLESQGTEVYSVNNIRMREDNRETIQFPTEQASSSLFVCSARVVLKLTNGTYSQPLDSTLAWNYYLAGGQRKFTITFKLKS